MKTNLLGRTKKLEAQLAATAPDHSLITAIADKAAQAGETILMTLHKAHIKELLQLEKHFGLSCYSSPPHMPRHELVWILRKMIVSRLADIAKSGGTFSNFLTALSDEDLEALIPEIESQGGTKP